MKLNYIFLLFLFVFAGCELIPDLERDNPLDENGTNYNGDNNLIDSASIVFDSYLIIEDDDNDGQAEVGETVYVQIVLKNNDDKVAKNVTVEYTIPNDYISFMSTTKIFGDIYANSLSEFNAEHLILDLKSSMPNNSVIPIKMQIYVDGKFNNVQSFNIVVK